MVIVIDLKESTHIYSAHTPPVGHHHEPAGAEPPAATGWDGWRKQVSKDRKKKRTVGSY